MPENREWWLDVGKTSTSTAGFISELELGSCCVITSKVADANITAGKLSTDSVTTDKITDANAVSCKISTNALTRVLTIPIPALESTEAGSLLSSAYVTYRATTPMRFTAVQVFPTGGWYNATCDHFVLFRNSSACVADVGFRSIASTAIQGVASCVGTIANALISADTILTVKTNVSTCSYGAAASNIVVHYISTA